MEYKSLIYMCPGIWKQKEIGRSPVLIHNLNMYFCLIWIYM